MEQVDTMREIRKFGYTMAVMFFAVSIFLVWRHKEPAPYFSALGVCFLGLTWFYAKGLIPVRDVWFAIGHGLGWFNTRLILILLFFIIFIPIRLILWILRKDLLDQKIEKHKVSYWKPRQAGPVNPLQYERLH